MVCAGMVLERWLAAGEAEYNENRIWQRQLGNKYTPYIDRQSALHPSEKSSRSLYYTQLGCASPFSSICMYIVSCFAQAYESSVVKAGKKTLQ